MRINNITKIFVVFIMGIYLLVSCHKKEKEQIAGTYIGQEQYIRIGPYLDTLKNETSSRTITLSLKTNRIFLLTKDTYPNSYEISANTLASDGTVTENSGLNPRHIWTIQIEGDILKGRFEENNGWAGSQDHYIFTGSK